MNQNNRESNECGDLLCECMILKWTLVQTVFELQNGLLLNVDTKSSSVRFTPQERKKVKSKIGVHLGNVLNYPGILLSNVSHKFRSANGF